MQTQMAMFMKNMSMLGWAFIISYFGAGPLSLDEKASHDKAAETVEEQQHRSAAWLRFRHKAVLTSPPTPSPAGEEQEGEVWKGEF